VAYNSRLTELAYRHVSVVRASFATTRMHGPPLDDILRLPCQNGINYLPI